MSAKLIRSWPFFLSRGKKMLENSFQMRNFAIVHVSMNSSTAITKNFYSKPNFFYSQPQYGPSATAAITVGIPWSLSRGGIGTSLSSPKTRRTLGLNLLNTGHFHMMCCCVPVAFLQKGQWIRRSSSSWREVMHDVAPFLLSNSSTAANTLA